MITHDEILAQLRKSYVEKRLNQKELAGVLGIAAPRVSEMLKGARRIQPREMPIVAKFLGMEDSDAPSLPEGAERVVQVPVLGDVPAGAVREAIRHSRGFVLAPESDAPRDSYALKVSGESMNVHAPNGCTIIINPNDTDLFPGRRYVVRDGDGETTFKEYRDGPARLVAVSSYDNYDDIRLGSEPIEVLGRVTSVITRI